MVDSIGGSLLGKGDEREGSRNLGQRASSVTGRHLLRENEKK